MPRPRGPDMGCIFNLKSDLYSALVNAVSCELPCYKEKNGTGLYVNLKTLLPNCAETHFWKEVTTRLT